MPWSEPRGGDSSVGGLRTGAPLLVVGRVTANGPGITSAFDFGDTRYIPLDNRIVGTLTNVTPTRVIGASDVFGRFVEFTNPATGQNNQPNIFPNYVDGGGFIMDGTLIFKTTTSDPATAVYTDITDPAFPSIYTFSMINGNMYSRRNSDGFLNVSSDGGTTWALAANEITPGGSDDIDHCFVSRDGSTVAIGSPLGISFMNTPENGSAGELGSLLSGAQLVGDFNANNNIFVWRDATTPDGQVNFTTDFNTSQSVPIANNPFQFDAASGREIRGIAYVPQLEGWIIAGDGTGKTCGFLAESDLTRIVQGTYIESELFSNSASRQTLVDGNGNFALVGNNMLMLQSVLYG